MGEDELGFTVPRTSMQVDSACGVTRAFDERPQEPIATVFPSTNISAVANITSADTTTQSNRAVATEDGSDERTQTTTTNQFSTTVTRQPSTPDAALALSGAWRSACALKILVMAYAAHLGLHVYSQ